MVEVNLSAAAFALDQAKKSLPLQPIKPVEKEDE